MSEMIDDAPAFRISTFSGGGACVAVAKMPDGNIAVRHSRRAHLQIIFTQREWSAFIAGVKHDEFDLKHDMEQA